MTYEEAGEQEGCCVSCRFWRGHEGHRNKSFIGRGTCTRGHMKPAPDIWIRKTPNMTASSHLNECWNIEPKATT